MNRVFSTGIIISLLLLSACGSKKSPTGGKQDLEKPELTETLPVEFADISGGVIELNFSKALDKTSVTRGLYIYPLIGNKSITVERNRVIIKIKEDLLADTNYYITLTPRIKDTHGNAFGINRTLIFCSGDLQKAKLSGVIKHEIDADQSLPIEYNLFSADSVLVFSTGFRGSTYAIDNLNKGEYLWKAFIDKDMNGVFDPENDPGDSGHFRITDIASVDMKLSYADTTSVKISSILPVSSTEVMIRFSEPVASYKSISLIRADGTELPIIAKYIDKRDMTLVFRAVGGELLKLILDDVRDFKGNLSSRLQMDFSVSTRIDEKAPQVISTIPRTGTSVNNSQPELTVNFSEPIDPSSIDASLKTFEGNTTIPLNVSAEQSKTLILKPQNKLLVNKEYILTVGSSCSDAFGNKIGLDTKISFLVLGS